MGVSFKMNDLRPYFYNQLNGKKNFVIFDACHMMKLLRNYLADDLIIKEGNNTIKWSFIDQLENFRSKYGLNTHKLTKKHTKWNKSARMDVRLAA